MWQEWRYLSNMVCHSNKISLFTQFWANVLQNSGVPRNFFRVGGVQQIRLRTEDRENGDMGAVAP